MSTNPPPQIQISILPPPASLLKDYNLHLSASAQSPSIPTLFKDSMSIRESIFVVEQGLVPLTYHINSEDGRSYHFIAYSNSIPIGTLRVLPPPNEKRPLNGTIIHPHPPGTIIPSGEELFGKLSEEEVKQLEETWEERPPTQFWDGKEGFLHFGRMSVLKEWRGKGVADILVQEAVGWAEREFRDVRWKGLMLANAREEARRLWERNGFVEDVGLGRWREVGVELFAVCRRVEVMDSVSFEKEME